MGTRSQSDVLVALLALGTVVPTASSSAQSGDGLPLEGTTWQLTAVAGFDGCNQFGGPYEAAGDTIGIGPLHATMMACGDPADTTEQQLLTALQASTVWLVRDGTLELRDDSGALQASLAAGVPAGSPSPC